MGWIRKRSAAFSWAKRHRAWLYGAGVLFLVAAGAEIWPQVREKISDWVVVPAPDEDGGMTIFGHPAWSIFVILGLVCACVWVFENMVKALDELSPKLEPSFDPEMGGLTETTLTNTETGEFVDLVKYVRLAVNSASQKSVQECVANIVKIERRLDQARTETIWDQDALPLNWSMTGGYETKVHYKTKRYVDVACVPKKTGQIKFLTIIPNRLAPELKKTGTFLLTVVVTGGGISMDGTVIEIETDGTFDGFKARTV